MLGRRRLRQDVEAEEQAVQKYALELRDLGPQAILAEVPSEAGHWPLPSFEDTRDGVVMKPGSMRRWQVPQRVLVVVQPEYQRRMYTPVAAGFAIAAGQIEDMTDDDWIEYWQ